MDAEFTDADWTREVLAALELPLREAGMGDPGFGPGRYVMWHADACSSPRPCADSPVWTRSGGCYDVIVREDAEPDGMSILTVHTEGAWLVDQTAPASAADLAALLGPVAAHIGQAIQDDFTRFESENSGYLPGTEPQPTSFADL